MPQTRREFMKCSATSSFLALAGHSVFADDPVTHPGKIKVAQIGSKHAHADGKLATLRKLSDLYEVIGVVETDPIAVKRIQNHPTYQGLPILSEQELFETEGLQAVAVETSIDQLLPTARRCLEHGLHIHLDKPAGSAEIDSARKLFRFAESKQLTVQMGYMFRYNPGFQLLFRALKENWLGPIREINGMIGKKAAPGLRNELANYAGGGMFELGCHLIDAVITVLGKPESVHGFNLHTQDDGFADNQTAIFSYPKATAVIRCNHTDPFGGPRRSFSVTGEKGTLEIRPLEHPVVELYLDEDQGPYQRGRQTVEFPPMEGRYAGEFRDLAAIIQGKKKLAWNADHDITVQECILEASGMI